MIRSAIAIHAVRGKTYSLNLFPTLRKLNQNETRFSGICNEGSAVVSDSNGFQRNNGGEHQGRPVCSHCKGVGHVKENFFKLLGNPLEHRLYNPNFKPSAVANATPKQPILGLQAEQIS